MTPPYAPILATLGYVFSPDRRKVLLVHRNARPEDYHLGKYNGLGGKVQRDEDVVAGMKREILEEAGIHCETLQLAGTISWPGFGKNGEDWFAFIFRILAWTGTPAVGNAEGSLAWVDVGEVMGLPMWPGDRHFLPIILDVQASPFHGVMPYQDGQPLHWRFHSAHV